MHAWLYIISFEIVKWPMSYLISVMKMRNTCLFRHIIKLAGGLGDEERDMNNVEILYPGYHGSPITVQNLDMIGSLQRHMAEKSSTP
jgi:hypothetical protein